MLVSVIIPVFQKEEVFFHCFTTLLRYLTINTELIIINDGSGKHVAATVERCLAEAKSERVVRVEMIEHEYPKGTVDALNKGFREATGDVVVLCDSDVFFDGPWMEAVLDLLERDEVGAVGGVLTYPQTGGIQCCGLTFNSDTARHLMLNNDPAALPAAPFPVQAQIFALCAMRADVIRKVGPLDRQYFNGYEDLDFQMRIRALGLEIYTHPKVRAFHWERSNGVHRTLNRKRNLGRFWRMHGHRVETDLWRYLESNIKKFLDDGNSGGRHYRLVDLCEDRVESHELRGQLMDNQWFHITDIKDVSHAVSGIEEIWLPQVLGVDEHRNQQPFIFLVQNFVRLLGNRYWIEARQRIQPGDVIIDLYANVISVNELLSSCWPGNKVR